MAPHALYVAGSCVLWLYGTAIIIMLGMCANMEYRRWWFRHMRQKKRERRKVARSIRCLQALNEDAENHRATWVVDDIFMILNTTRRQRKCRTI